MLDSVVLCLLWLVLFHKKRLPELQSDSLNGMNEAVFKRTRDRRSTDQFN